MTAHRKRPKKLYKVNWLKSVRRKKRVKVLYKRMARQRARIARPFEAAKA